MIPFEFDYHNPSNINECVNLYNELIGRGNKPVYYSGGTEIISMARVDNLRFDNVIDIKGISECRQLGIYNNKLIIGAGVELNAITESNLYPLLGNTLRRIADHTIQCKVTIGGNILGTIIYKEGILPLLIADAEVTIANNEGIYTKKLSDIYNNGIKLNAGELLINFIVDINYLNNDWIHIKKTKIEKIDYPLITMNAMKYKGKIRIAFSGLCRNPFRSLPLERIINEKDFDVNKDIIRLTKTFPENVLDNQSGGSDYRIFVLKELINTAMDKLRGKIC